MFLHDGFQTWIGFPDLAPNIALVMKEREVQPPDMDGGGEIETSTMRNTRWRTKAPKSLITLGDVTLQVQYDPSLYNDILALINVNTRVEIKFPDTSTLTFYGWVDKFTPPSHKEGEFPVAEIKVHCSNVHAGTGAEQAPVYAIAP